jgi:hyperosmotically inducible periplasmic protein
MIGTPTICQLSQQPVHPPENISPIGFSSISGLNQITTVSWYTMNKIKTTNIPKFLLLSGLLMASLSACSAAKTASDAPNSTSNNGVVSAEKNVQATQADAQDATRKKQLEADIRSREQRNNMGGDPQKRAEEDLASEVRSKLEANIPRGKLTVTAEKSDITVAGVVGTQAQLDKIKPLAMEIKGVRSVTVKAVVNP